MASELISIEDAAKLLKMSPQQVNDLVQRRDIAAVRGGAALKIKMDEIERFADERGISLGGPGDMDASLTFEAEDQEVNLDESTSGSASSSILVSEIELGSSQSPSSTVIGDDEGAGGHDSDLVLSSDGDAPTGTSSLRLDVASSDLKLASDSSLALSPKTVPHAKAQAKAPARDSDLNLAADGSDVEPTDSDLEKLGGSDLELTGDSDIDLGAEVMTGAGESDLLLAGASDLGPGDTGKLDVKGKSSNLEFATDELDIELDDSGSALDLGGDDDLVLDGESALDDDIALAGDSGINLAKPSDSGIDLGNADESGIAVVGDSGFMLEDDDALQLEGGSSADSLALPDDVDIVSLGADLADPDSATMLKSDEDFDLTPVEGAIEDESDSGSQVIALDADALDADAPTQLGGLAVGAIDMEPVITEEADAGGLAVGMQPGMQQQPGMGAVPQQQQAAFPVQEMPETPYSIWQVASLTVVLMMLAFTGILMVDVVRNIWSFDEPYSASTSIMTAIVDGLGI